MGVWTTDERTAAQLKVMMRELRGDATLRFRARYQPLVAADQGEDGAVQITPYWDLDDGAESCADPHIFYQVTISAADAAGHEPAALLERLGWCEASERDLTCLNPDLYDLYYSDDTFYVAVHPIDWRRTISHAIRSYANAELDAIRARQLRDILIATAGAHVGDGPLVAELVDAAVHQDSLADSYLAYLRESVDQREPWLRELEQDAHALLTHLRTEWEQAGR